MRVRNDANPFGEAHARGMRTLDWIAPVGTDPHAIPALLAAAVPGLTLADDGSGEVNGFVNTSRRPDGALYVAVTLYDAECTDPDCPAGHGPITHRKAPTLTAGQRTSLKSAVGEHPDYKLTGGTGDRAVLLSLGLSDEPETDAPVIREP